MTAIVYCFYVPEHDEKGNLLPFPPHVLRWSAFHKDGDEPVYFGVVPYIVNTKDEQIALRTIAPRHDVAALHMLKSDAVAHLSRFITCAEQAPLTWIADTFVPRDVFGGTVHRNGLEIPIKAGDNVLLTNQVHRLQYKPFEKCIDQTAVERVKDIIARRERGERGLKWATDPKQLPSCTVVHPETFARVMRTYKEGSFQEYQADLPESAAGEPAAVLPEIGIVRLPPRSRPGPLPSEPAHTPDRYKTVATTPAPSRPEATDTPAHSDDAPRRRFRADIDG